MPFSAVLELAALLLFAANALRTTWPGRDPVSRRQRVTRATRLSVLLAEYPWLEDRLMAWGLGYVERVREVPRPLTLGTCAATNGLDPNQLVARINEALAESER